MKPDLPAISEANPVTEADIRGQVEDYRLFVRNEGGFLVGEGAQDDPRVYESITHIFPRPEAMKVYEKLVAKLPRLIQASEFWPWRGRVENEAMGYGLADRNAVTVIYACLSDEIKRQLCTSTRLPRIWKVIPRHVFMNLIRHVISAPDGRTYATSLLHAAKQKDTEDVVAYAHRLAIIMTAVGTMKQTERGLTLPTAHSRDLFTHYLSQGLKDEESKGIVKAEPHVGEEVYTYKRMIYEESGSGQNQQPANSWHHF